MINLIPNQEKKEMIKGFYFRLVVLFLVAGGVSFLLALVFILPSYFLSSAKEKIIDQKLETQRNEPVPLLQKQTLAVVKDLNNKLNLIENAEKNKFNISEKVISPIVLKKMSAIKITNISYENDLKNNPLSGKKISIQGTAPSREVLLLFRKALEDSPAFKQVNLPISNFIKGFNIQFYLSLIPS